MNLKLFEVTLPWNPSDSEEGDYCVNTWAKSEDAAIRNVAEEMADHPDSGCQTDNERKQFVEGLIPATRGGVTPVRLVKDSVLSDIEDLLKGEQETLTAAAKRDLAAIKKIVARYC